MRAREGSVAPSVVAGVVVGASGILNATALAALVFKGDLAQDLAAGAGVTLYTMLCMGVVVALLGSYRGTVAVAQDTSIAIVALAAAAVAHAMAGAPQAARLATVLVTLGATTLVVGVVFLLLGSFKLGGLVRFLPYPVVGGFLAGSGWLLANGALNVVTGVAISPSTANTLLTPAMLVRWVPALLFAVGMHVLLRRVKHYLAVPLYMIVSLAIFFALVAISGHSFESVRTAGLMLGPFPRGGLFHPITPSSLARVQWSVVAAQVPTMLVVALVSAIGLLLNITGLELATKQEIDANRELRVAGLANLLSGLGGGIPGYHGLSSSILGRRMGGGSRVTGVLVGAMGGLGLMMSTRALSFVPTFILGGLLLFLSLDFLLEWVVVSARKLPHGDYAIVLSILLAIGIVGFLPGVAFGVALSLAIFVFNYARLDVVRHAFSGTYLRSKVERSATAAQYLEDHGGEVFVMELVGFLFFGTANQIVERVRERVGSPAPLRLLILDFRHVVGLDSSAMSTFVKIRDMADTNGFELALADVSLDLLDHFVRNGLVSRSSRVRVHASLDAALEVWENAQMTELARSTGPSGVRATLSRLLEPDLVERVMKQLTVTNYAPNAVVFDRGDRSRDLLFIESGRLRARLVLPTGRELRLQSMTSGALVGEIAFCLHRARAADVVAEQASVVYRLSAEKLRELEQTDGALAIGLHKLIARVLAARLSETTRALEAALR